MLPMVAADFKKPGTVKEPVGPREWLGLIENADYVLTDSFHCTLFSIRFHKQFNVLQRFKEGDKRGQNSRIHTLLQTANMQNRLVGAGRGCHNGNHRRRLFPNRGCADGGTGSRFPAVA